MDQKIELKPCPFCGSDRVRLMAKEPNSNGERCINYADEVDEYDAIHIYCYECGCSLSVCGDSLDLADIWNMRCNNEQIH